MVKLGLGYLNFSKLKSFAWTLDARYAVLFMILVLVVLFVATLTVNGSRTKLSMKYFYLNFKLKYN